jgi:hypothetical protein
LDVFDDESSTEDVRKTIDTLVGMYKGDLFYPLTVARNTHAQAVFTMTSGNSVPQIAANLGQLQIDYMYAPVTPKRAIADLGYWVETEEDAVRLLQRILPPLPPNQHGVSTEDFVIGTLREWDPKEPVNINRLDWLQVLSDALLRVITEEVNIRIAHPEISDKDSHLTPKLPPELMSEPNAGDAK